MVTPAGDNGNPESSSFREQAPQNNDRSSAAKASQTADSATSATAAVVFCSMPEERESDFDAHSDLWFAPRLERRECHLASGEILECAAYQIVGGQQQAFEAMRAFSDENNEAVAVDLAGLNDAMRAAFIAFLETTGLTQVEWVSGDVLVMTASSSGPSGTAGVREPRRPVVPDGHLSTEARLT